MKIRFHLQNLEDRKWRGTDDNIPAEDAILVVPVNLHSQMTEEIRRYLIPGSLDILPYTGTLKGRLAYWTEIADQSKQPRGQRLLLATSNVRLHRLAISC